MTDHYENLCPLLKVHGHAWHRNCLHETIDTINYKKPRLRFKQYFSKCPRLWKQETAQWRTNFNQFFIQDIFYLGKTSAWKETLGIFLRNQRILDEKSFFFKLNQHRIFLNFYKNLKRNSWDWLKSKLPLQRNTCYFALMTEGNSALV